MCKNRKKGNIMSDKKKIRKQLIRMQNAYGKREGKVAWKKWKESIINKKD